MNDDPCIIVSAGNDRDVFAGGLFAIQADELVRIDHMAAAGLFHSNGRVYRIASKRQHEGAELITYDHEGVVSFSRLDGLPDPHDVLALADGTLLAVSPTLNAVMEITSRGDTRVYWQAHAPLDAWHVNCITEQGGRLFATAFGRFDRCRGWSDGCKGTGVLFDLETGEDVISGLSRPHTPRWIDGGWVVCNSGAGGLARVTQIGRIDVELGGFPRGICVVGQYVYVGVGRLKASGGAAPSHIAVLDRETWRVVRRIAMPDGNPYDLIAVDQRTVEGLRAGSDYPSRRTRNLDQLAMFGSVGVAPSRLWAVGEPLSANDCRVTVDAPVCDVMVAGEGELLECVVTSRSGAFLVSAPPNPVYVSYRWLDQEGAELSGPGLRAPLPRALAPSQSCVVCLMVRAPAQPGRYTLVVTLLQAHVRWFDDADGCSALRRPVTVVCGVTDPDRTQSSAPSP